MTEFEILSAAGGVTDAGVKAVDTGVVDYSVRFDTQGNRVFLGATLDFARAPELTAKQAAIGQSLNTALPTANAATLDFLYSLLTLQGSQLGAIYDGLVQPVSGSQQSEAAVAATHFAKEMMSCRVDGDQLSAAIREGECLWARARARHIDVDQSAGSAGSQSTVGSFTAGVQVAVAPDWRAGVAIGYDTVSMSSGSNGSTDGERVNVGGVVKYNPGSLLLAAGVASGWGENETERVVGFTPTKSKSDIDYVSGWLHAAYLFDQGSWYAKPLVDLRLTETQFGGAYSGGGVRVLASDGTQFSVSPGLELGTQFRFDTISVWRPFVRAGVTWIDDPTFVTKTDIGGSVFNTVSTSDDVLFDFSAGVDVINKEGAAMRFEYDGSFGSNTTQNSVALKGSVPF